MAERTKSKPTRQSEDDILNAALERVRGQQGGGEQEDETDVEQAAAPAATKEKKKTGATAPVATTATVPRSKVKTSKIAYTPLDREDPSFTIFFGMKFEANVEREVSNIECIKLATQNPWFKVDGKHHAKRVKPPAREQDENAAVSGLPDGADPEKVEVEAEAEDFA